jgi:hypothetical protein
VRAGFHDAALVQHDNHVGVQNGREPVRDANGRAALHQFVERGLHGAFGFGVERAGGFVQDQNRRVLQNGAGDGEALALAAGKRDAFFADDGVEALGFLHDEIVGVGVFGGGDDFVVRRAEPAQLDVPADGVVEQNVFLRDDGDLVPQVARGNLAQIHAADFDRAACGVVKTQEQVGERGFAGAAGADERDELAGLDGEVDVVQDRFFAVVEIEVLKFDVGVVEAWSIFGCAGSGTEFFVASSSKTRSLAARA